MRLKTPGTWTQIIVSDIVLALLIGLGFFLATEHMENQRVDAAQELESRQIERANELEDRRVEEAQRIEEARIASANELEARVNAAAAERELQSALSSLDVSGANLAGQNLTGFGLQARSFKFSRMVDAVLDRSDLSNSDLSTADLAGASLSEVTAFGTRFRDATMTETSLDRLRGSLTAENIDAHESDWTSVVLSFSHFNGAILTRTNWSDCEIEQSSFQGADASFANFDGCTLSKVDFRGSNLNQATFVGADLRSVDFRGADLRGADFSGATFLSVSVDRAAITSLDPPPWGDEAETSNADTIGLPPVEGQNYAVHISGTTLGASSHSGGAVSQPILPSLPGGTGEWDLTRRPLEGSMASDRDPESLFWVRCPQFADSDLLIACRPLDVAGRNFAVLVIDHSDERTIREATSDWPLYPLRDEAVVIVELVGQSWFEVASLDTWSSNVGVSVDVISEPSTGRAVVLIGEQVVGASFGYNFSIADLGEQQPTVWQTGAKLMLGRVNEDASGFELAIGVFRPEESTNAQLNLAYGAGCCKTMQVIELGWDTGRFGEIARTTAELSGLRWRVLGDPVEGELSLRPPLPALR